MIEHFLGRPVRLTASFVKAACFAHLTYAYGPVQCFPAAGPSMLPTFAVTGDWLVADMTRRRGRGIAVGDIVVYKIPIFADQGGVKRVVGMPGDYVSMGTPGEAGEERMIQIPEGHCWVVGDNMPASRDSRQFGPLPLALITGKVTGQILPWQERKWIVNGLESAQDES
ncbi:LexA/Signal peptidase [Paramyrothecium foliicola]|nr:LexA/Signal peptidase [Paramyrothecium foliicola]